MKEQNIQLTEHFTLAEMTRTSVKGVDNTPTAEAVENLKRVCRWLVLRTVSKLTAEMPCDMRPYTHAATSLVS